MNVITNEMEELKDNTSNMINILTLLCRIHYMKQSFVGFSTDQYLYLLKEFKTLAIAPSLRLFKRPNHKDRYCHFIHYLATNIDVFVQVTYLSLVTKSAPADKNVMTQDDMMFFCYHTFPAIFHYFLSKDDRERALEFIKKLLQLHFYLHGSNFSEDHEFITHLMFSYFLTTNPGQFFENSIQPLLPSFENIIKDKHLKYSISVEREIYWSQIVSFTFRLIKKMCTAIPLLPFSSLQLISMLMGIDAGSFPIKYFLIIRGLFCNYLSKYVTCSYPEIMSDVCVALKALFPREYKYHVNIPVETAIQTYNASLDPLFEALNVNLSSLEKFNDSTESLDLCSRFSLFTTRDLKLMFQSYTYYMSYLQESNVKTDLNNLFTGLDLPTTVNDHQYIAMRAWGNDQIPNEISLESTHPYDEIIDAINLSNFNQLTFETPEELIQQVVKYSGFYMNPIVKLHVLTQPKVLLDTTECIDTLNRNTKVLSTMSDQLSTALFVIDNEVKRHSKQLSRFEESIVKDYVVPALIEGYPDEFLFAEEDLFSSRDSLQKITTNVNQIVSSLGLIEQCEFMIKKEYLLGYVDQIDNAFHFQGSVLTDKSTEVLSKYLHDHQKYESGLPMQTRRLLSRAATDFQQVKATRPISFNLTLVFRSMKLLEVFPQDVCRLAISIAGNNDLFGFSYFVSKYLNSSILSKELLTKQEQENLVLFVQAVNAVRINKK